MFKKLRKWWYRKEFNLACILYGDDHVVKTYKKDGFGLRTKYVYWCYVNRKTNEFLISTSYGFKITGYIPKNAVPAEPFFNCFIFKNEYHDDRL